MEKYCIKFIFDPSRQIKTSKSVLYELEMDILSKILWITQQNLMFTSLKITNTKLDLYVHKASISHSHGELFGISTIIEKKI